MKGKGSPLFLLCTIAFGASCGATAPAIAPLVGGGEPAPAAELSDVPFFPQTARQCGPASLAAVLVNAGIDTSPGELAGEVFIPGRGGSLQVEMSAAVRRRGLIPSPLGPDLSSLIAVVGSGRPALVLQDLGVPGWRRWHYAVVIGFDARRDTLVLRSGTRRRKVMKASRFARSWRASDRWGVAVLRPGEIPVGADREGYLLQVAALEEAGRGREAEAGYGAALAVWPDDEAALLGRGNAVYMQGEPERAVQSFRALLERHPESTAGRNNLAHVLMELGRLDEAEEEIVRALTLAREQGKDPGVLLETQREIRQGMPHGPASRRP